MFRSFARLRQHAPPPPKIMCKKGPQAIPTASKKNPYSGNVVSNGLDAVRLSNGAPLEKGPLEKAAAAAEVMDLEIHAHKIHTTHGHLGDAMFFESEEEERLHDEKPK